MLVLEREPAGCRLSRPWLRLGSTPDMKNKNRLGPSPVPFLMMIGFACVPFSQALTASAQTKRDLNAVFADGGPATATFSLNSGYNALKPSWIKTSAQFSD